MSEHSTKTEKLQNGSVKASCTCGWISRWSVADGSAEQDASLHKALGERKEATNANQN